jgi:hypothetical protein
MNDAVATVTHDFSMEMLRWKCMLQAYVSSVSDILEVCCNCFIWMLQKQIKDVAHIASVSEVCYNYFIWILQK